MSLYDPFGFRPQFAAPDQPADLPPSLIYETQAPNAFALTRQGSIAETQVPARREAGEIFTTTQGDVVVRTVRVESASESYEVEVTQIDVGGGIEQLQVVAYDEPPPVEVIEAVVTHEIPATETVTYVDPYVATETSAAPVSPEPIPVEVQVENTAVTAEVPYDPTYGGQAYPTELPVAEVNTGGGETTVIDPSLYDYFGFTS